MFEPKYRWKAIYSDCELIFDDLVDVKKEGLLKIEIEHENRSKISLALDGKTPIFYRRIFGILDTGEIENIIYFLGYTLNESSFLLSLNSNTGEIRIEDDLFK